jgi:phage terminase Nu1 subunit (DNA packaging protein)
MVKDSLSELTISQLETLTGKQYRTIKRRLGSLAPLRTDGTSIYYDPRQALPLLFGEASAPAPSEEDVATPFKSKHAIKLERLKAEKAELEVARLKGKLLPTELVEEIWTDMVSSFRSKLRGIPTKVALEVAAISDPREAEGLLRSNVDEALMELAAFEPAAYGVEAPAAPNAEREPDPSAPAPAGGAPLYGIEPMAEGKTLQDVAAELEGPA